MKRPLLGLLSAAVAGVLSTEAAGAYSVDMPAAPAKWEVTAVRELTNYLAQVALDGRITVEGKGNVVFHVGDTSFARDKGLGTANLKSEEWVIRSFGRDVVLNGGGTRGCLYSVYHFLEDQCGVRWWCNDDEDVPDAKPLAFKKLDRRGKPFWLHRNIYCGRQLDSSFMARCRVNVNGEQRIPAEYGGDDKFGPPYHCGAFERLLPWNRYGKTHPEWYSLVGGKRRGGYKRGQLCLTCPGLLEPFVKSLESYIEKGNADADAKGLPRPRLYSVTANDNMFLCQCEGCKNERKKYGASGFHLRFLNQVAARIAKSHPECLVVFNAYHESEMVPKGGVRAADNMLILLANTRQNMASGIRDPENHLMHDAMAAWKNYAKNLGVWEYAVTYMGITKGFPFPSEFYIPDRYRYYAEQGANHIMLEHEFLNVSDMYDLKFYLERKSLEDPFGVKLEDLLQDFMGRYFGKAGGKILAARRHLDKIRRERKAIVKWSPNFSEFGFFKMEDVLLMSRLWDEAEEMSKDNPKVMRRLKRARNGLDRYRNLLEMCGNLHDPEPGVSNRPFYDFPVTNFTWYVYNNGGKDPAQQFEPDSRAPLGIALRITGTASEYNKLPFALGVFDMTKAKTSYLGKFSEVNKEDGYSWYDFKDVPLPAGGFYIYMLRSWTIRIPATPPTLCGTICDIRVHIDFQGPLYGKPGTESRLLIDRAVFIPKGEIKK